MNHDLRRKRTAPPDLDHVAETVRIGRFANETGVESLALFPHRPIEKLDRSIDRRPLFVARDQKGDAPFGKAILCDLPRDSGDKGGNAALHVHGTASVKFAIDDVGRKGWHLPIGLFARRHHIRVTSKDQVRPRAPRGEEVLDIRRIRIRERRAIDRETERLQHRLKGAQGPALVRRHGATADQFGEDGDGIGRIEIGRKYHGRTVSSQFVQARPGERSEPPSARAIRCLSATGSPLKRTAGALLEAAISSCLRFAEIGPHSVTSH